VVSDPISNIFQNFEKAILFSIVETDNNYVFRGNVTPHSPWERPVSYEICPLFTYSISFREVYSSGSVHTFFWMGGFFAWVGVRRENFSWE